MDEMDKDGGTTIQGTSLNTLPRKELVDTATKFLTNVKVISRPESEKVAFLKKKGLTDTEIQVALSEANSYSNHVTVQTTPSFSHLPVQPYVAQRMPTFWSRMRDYTSFIIFLSGFAYGCHYLYQQYIGPFLTGRRKKSIEETLLESQSSFKTAIEGLHVELKEIKESITELNETLKIISINNATKEASVDADELKKEITCLKGLMLNKNAFPLAPAASIPSWQIKGKKKSNGDATSPTLSKELEEPSQVAINGDAEANSQNLETTADANSLH